MDERRPMIAGNWKMHLTRGEAAALAATLCRETAPVEGVDVLIAPAFTALAAVKEAIQGSKLLLGAQNLHWEEKGAFTGEVSASMLADAGCTHVILGHSERRTLFGESDETVDRKVGAALRFGLTPIVCFGETLEQREGNRTFEVVGGQLRGSLRGLLQAKSIPHTTILAYEPVWAIGTGRTAEPAQAQEVHGFVRKWLADQFDPSAASRVRVLYGGSVKPDNAGELMSMPDIDGALVGGASLKADSFVPIVRYKK